MAGLFLGLSSVAVLPALGLGAAVQYQMRPHPMDTVEARKRAFQLLPGVVLPEGSTMERKDFVTSKGTRLSYVDYTPKGKIKAVIYICHGYMDNTNWLWHGRAAKFLEVGYKLIGVDFEGHGLSDGMLGYIENYDRLVEGGFEMFKSRFEEFSAYKKFIMGESMGGATVIHMLLSHGQEHWDGVILLAPMCKIADNVTPPALVIKALVASAEKIPTCTIVPGPDLVPLSFRDTKYVQIMNDSPFRFKRYARVKTAVELFHATQRIATNMEAFSAPLLILQGDADVVTDPVTSREFHDRCKSTDKEYKLYKGSFHCLYEEPNADEVMYKDTFAWIEKRL